MDRLIESVTIYRAETAGLEAEIVAQVWDLAVGGTSGDAVLCYFMVLVAGVGFEPTTFRL